MSMRTDLQGPIRALGVAMAVVSLAAAGSAASAQAQDCPAPPPQGQTSKSYTYAGGNQPFAVPAYVDHLDVTVRGGYGGSSAGKTAAGGRPGLVTGRLPVTGGSCLSITVGGYQGGFGYGSGGSTGSTPHGFDGKSGGGGSAISPLGGAPLVVAGGGGGAGGNSYESTSSDGSPGGAGGDGANGGGPGTPQGGVGGLPPRHFKPSFLDGAPVNGQRVPGNGPSGTSSGDTDIFCGKNAGTGGGGGGGYQGGGAGLTVYDSLDLDPESCRTTVNFGGGGGAGGDSYGPSLTGAQFAVDPGVCPPDGGAVAACQGAVTVSWSTDVGTVTPAGGAKQSAYIDARYRSLLQARVTSPNGAPIPGLAVTFTLPAASGPTGAFDTGATPSSTVSVMTDATGTATAPVVIAGDRPGNFTATATVEGTGLVAPFQLTNLPVPTATSLSTLPGDPSVTQEPVRFVANVGQSPSSAPVPAGTVVFSRAGTAFDSVPVDANGVAVSGPVPLGVGNQAVTAIFQPTDRFLGSQASMTQHVVKAGTAVDISSSANPSENGDPVTFDATVVPLAPAAGTPTGSVTFTVDGTPLGAETTLVAGHATSAVTHLGDGPHDVIATYTGDTGYLPSTGSSRQSVGHGVTATTLKAEPRSPVVGQASLITVKVAPPSANATDIPSGGVDVLVDGVVVCDDLTLVAGTASCSVTSPLLPGPHDITAQYLPGSGSFLASSGRLTQLVSKGRAEMTIEATPDPSVFGQQVTLHAQAAAAGAARGTPTGSVQFTVDGVAVGDPVLLRDAQADSIPIPRLNAGPHVIRAQYGGDASFVANAIADTQSVDPGETLGALTSSAVNSALGAEVRFTMQVGIVAPALGQPGGSVQFTVDGRDLGQPVPVFGGAAVSTPVSTLTAGAHMVRGSYLGDPGFSRVDGLLTQRIVAPVRPTVIPSRDRSPLLCERTLDITSVVLANGRVRVAGLATAPLVGTEVSIQSGGAELGRPTVKADGTFTADVRRPFGVLQKNLALVATAGSARSATVKVVQALRIVHVRSAGKGKVRVEALLTGAGTKKLRAGVRRRIACGKERTVTKPKVGAATRKGGARRIIATVNRPDKSLGTAAVTVVVGKQVSMPVLVTP